jgi:hypothetical protein
MFHVTRLWRVTGEGKSMARALILCAALACGCARAAQGPPVPVTVEVPVPQPVWCALPPPARPVLPISHLAADSPPADTMRAYAATVVILKAAVVEREDLLRACAPPADSAQSPAGAIGAGGAAAKGAQR